MKPMRFLLILCGLCILLGEFCAASLRAAVSGTAFEEMLPEDIAFYVSVPDTAKLVANFKQSNAYKIIRQIDPFALMSKQPEFQRAKERYNTFIQPLTQIFQKRLALAIKSIPATREVPVLVFLADVCGKKEALQKYLTDRVHPFLKERGAQEVSFTHAGYQVQQFSFGGPPAITVSYAIADDVFIATVGTEAIKRLLESPRRERSLANSQLFQDVRKKVGESSDLLIYGNFSALLEGLGPAMALEAKTRTLPETRDPAHSMISTSRRTGLGAIGLTGLKALGMGLQTRGSAAKQTVFLATGPDRKGFLSLLARKSAPLKVVGYIPEDTTFFATFAVGDFGQFWDELLATIGEAARGVDGHEAWQRTVEKLKQWEDRSGLKIREDMLAPFAGEICLAAKVPDTLGVPQVLVFIGVKDAQKANELIGKLIAAAEKALGVKVIKTTEEHKGVLITSVTLLPPAKAQGPHLALVPLALVRPAFAVVGDVLVVGVHSNSIKKVVEVHQGSKSLKDSPQFKNVMANLSDQGTATSYLNVRDLYDFLYGVLAPYAAVRLGPDTVAKLAKIREYLGVSASRLSCDEKGITYETFSDSGLAEQALLLVVPAAFVPKMVSSRESARAAVCLNNLRQLAMACHLFAQDHEGVLPSKLSDLYPNTVDSVKIFVCPAHRGEQISSASIETESDYKLEIPGAKLADIKDPAHTIMISEKEPHHDGGRNAAYADGHVQAVRGGPERAGEVPVPSAK